MLLFLFISCEQEEIIDFGDQSSLEQQKSSKSKNTSKFSDEQLIEQIEDLKNGTKRAYHRYNKKHPNHNFNKRFGKPIVKETKYIQFTDEDHIIMILPLVKKKDKKRKILVSYYKNGKKTYKIFTKKKYNRHIYESVLERNILNSLFVIFNKKLKRKTESQKSILYKSEDSWVFVRYRYGGCVEEWVNTDTSETWFQANQLNPCPDEKGNGENEDECDDEYPWCDDPTWDSDPDPGDDNMDDEVNDYCDSSDPDCEESGGGSSDSGGSDDGNNNSTSSYTLSEEPEFQYPINSTYATDYPKFTEYLKNKIPLIYDIPKIINAIHDITNLPYYEIEDDLQFDSGPIIEIVQLDDYAFNTSERTVGVFDDKNPNKLFLDIDYVLELENNNDDQIIQDGLLFYLGVVLLHEYVHYGVNKNNVIYQGEEGQDFELKVYGEDMTPSSAEWLILNKYY